MLSADGVRGGHDVLRQRARLVRKDVLDRAELLRELHIAHQSRRVRLFVVHLEVIFDEAGLEEFDRAHTDVKRNGHKIGH